MKTLNLIGIVNLLVGVILFSHYRDPLDIFIICESLFLIHLL
jgi:hypothetical protein